MKKALADRQAALADKWIRIVLETYKASDYFKSQKDQFANPVGHSVAAGLKSLLEILINGYDPDKASGPLESIIKIRAVQDFTPSQAVYFVFVLKKLVREELAQAKSGADLAGELAGMEADIDALALLAFDIYMESRERLFKIRIGEFEKGTHVLTDGTQCASAMLRRRQRESAGSKLINSIT